MVDLFTRLGYIVSVAANPTSIFAGNSVTVTGSVVGSDGSYPAIDDLVTLSPGGDVSFLSEGLFGKNVLLGVPGTQIITATYTPDATCEESFSDSTTVEVRNGGGGGGGGGGGSASECADGYVRDENDVCVKVPEPPQETQTGGSQTQVSGGSQTQENSDNQTQEKEPEPTPPEEPASPITGAVTGGGFGGLTWLWILLGVIVALLGLWLIARKK